MTEEERFGLCLIRWLSIFLAACIFLICFCTTHDGALFMYKQYNKDIKDISFTGGTILNNGCGIISTVCVLQFYNIEHDINYIISCYNKAYPNQIVKGVNPEFFYKIFPEYNLEITYKKILSEEEIQDIINHDGCIIVLLPKNLKPYTDDSKHYIFLYAYDNNGYIINNPSSKSKKLNRISYNNLSKAEGFYIVYQQDILK